MIDCPVQIMKTIVWRILLVLTLISRVVLAGDITSSLAITARSGDVISYQITSTVGDDAFCWAQDLPPGLLCDTSGAITGTISVTNSTGSTITYTSLIHANSPDDDTAEDYLVWTVTPIRQATVNPSISHVVQDVTQPVTLTRDGSVYYSGSVTTETIIKRPDASTLVTSYSGFGSSNYVPDGGTGVYEYTLKVTDSTGASLVSPAPLVFVIGYAWLMPASSTLTAMVPLPEVQVGQSAGVKLILSAWSMVSTATVTVDPTLDTVSGITYLSGPAVTTATILPIARGPGSHWIWGTGYGYPYGYSGGTPVPTGTWWGNGAFLTVNKATPAVTFSSRSYAANSSGYYSVVAGDLNAAFANPFSSGSGLTVGGLSLIGYRLGLTSLPFTAGTQLPSGTYYVNVTYPGNNDYNATITWATFTVGGPTTPRFLRAVPGSGSAVVLSWRGSTGGTSYQVFKDGVSLGTTTSESFTDTGAVAGAAVTYTVKALDGSGNSSLPATAAYNALEILSPAL